MDFVLPQLHQLAAQRLGRKHVERRERLVQAQQLWLDGHGAGEAHLLSHAAGELARVGRLEAVQADGVDQLEGRVLRRSASGTPRAFSATSTFSCTVSHG